MARNLSICSEITPKEQVRLANNAKMYSRQIFSVKPNVPIIIEISQIKNIKLKEPTKFSMNTCIGFKSYRNFLKIRKPIPQNATMKKGYKISPKLYLII